MLGSAVRKVLNSTTQRRVALHRRQRIAATRQSLTDAPFGAEFLVSIPGGATAVHTLHIAAKNKNLAVGKFGDAVRRDTLSIDYLFIIHNVCILIVTANIHILF